jgi:hypothetical protein
MPLNAQLLKTALEDLEVPNKLVVVLRLPVDLVQGHLARVDYVDYLAVDAPGAQLLDLCDVQLREYATVPLAASLSS